MQLRSWTTIAKGICLCMLVLVSLLPVDADAQNRRGNKRPKRMQRTPTPDKQWNPETQRWEFVDKSWQKRQEDYRYDPKEWRKPKHRRRVKAKPKHKPKDKGRRKKGDKTPSGE